MEHGGVMGSSRPIRTVGKIQLESNGEMLSNEGIVVVTSQTIDVAHHTCWPMEDLKEVTCPAADLMDRAIVLQNLLDGAAITKPKEFRTT
jgi:hypothetical protein